MDLHTLRWFRFAYGLWLFGLIAYFVPAPTWNPISRFSLTRAIVERGSLSIDAYADGTGDRALFKGVWYTDKAPIPSLLAVPVYAAIHSLQKYQGLIPAYEATPEEEVPAVKVRTNKHYKNAFYLSSLFTSGVAAVIIGLLLFELLRRHLTPLSALFGATCTVLGTPILPYATSFYGHVIAGAFLTTAVFLIFGNPSLSSSDDRPSSLKLRIVGACLALAPGSEYITAVISILLGGWILAIHHRRDRLGILSDLLLGAATPIAVVAVYHTLCFGAPWHTGYSFVVKPSFADGHAKGLLGVTFPNVESLVGLLVGVRRGLFFVSPALVVATIMLFIHAFVRGQRIARIALVSVILLYLTNASYYMWWGGAAAGPRHLVPVLPLLGIGLGYACQRRWSRYVLIPLVLLSMFNMLAVTSVGLEAPEEGNVLQDYAWQRLLYDQIGVDKGGTNLGVNLGFHAIKTIIPALIWLVVGMVCLSLYCGMASRTKRVR